MVEPADVPRVVAGAARLVQCGELVDYGSTAAPSPSGSSMRRGATTSIPGATRPGARDLLRADSMALAREGPGEITVPERVTRFRFGLDRRRRMVG